MTRAVEISIQAVSQVLIVSGLKVPAEPPGRFIDQKLIRAQTPKSHRE